MFSSQQRSRGSGTSFRRTSTPSHEPLSLIDGRPKSPTPVDVYLYTDDNGSVHGFAAIRSHELLHFGTALPTWGTGLASRLHDALLEVAARSLDTPTTLTLHVFDENRRARRFYAKHGWQPTGRTSRTTFAAHPLLLEYERHLA